jgi:hypothetical protein
MSNVLRAGILRGGRGAFIGSVHRVAAEFDGQVLIFAGAMSADPRRARDVPSTISQELARNGVRFRYRAARTDAAAQKSESRP